jgi:hypothetical protein
MSGGTFKFLQYSIDEALGTIRRIVKDNKYENNFSKPVIDKIKEGISIIHKAYVYLDRIDYLIAGDDGEENFLRRLKEDLEE